MRLVVNQPSKILLALGLKKATHRVAFGFLALFMKVVFRLQKGIDNSALQMQEFKFDLVTNEVESVFSPKSRRQPFLWSVCQILWIFDGGSHFENLSVTGNNWQLFLHFIHISMNQKD